MSTESVKRVKYSPWQHFLQYMRSHGPVFHIIATILWVWALSLLAVFAMGFLISATDGLAYALDPGRVFPETFTLKNYVKAYETIEYTDVTFVGMLFNSIWFSVGCMACRLLATTCATYVIARYEFKGRKALYTFIIIQLMIPTYSGGVSNYTYMWDLGLVNTPLFLISQFAGHGYYFLVMHSYFVGIDKSYDEAASLDGANDFQIFCLVIMPIARSAILAIGLMTFVDLWNEYMTPILYLDNYPTLMSGLFKYKTVATYTLDTPVYFAGLLLAALPTGILFTCFSGTLMKNLTIGGIKG